MKQIESSEMEFDNASDKNKYEFEMIQKCSLEDERTKQVIDYMNLYFRWKEILMMKMALPQSS